MTREELKRKFRNMVDVRAGSAEDLVDAIIDCAVDEVVDRIENRKWEKRSTERRVGYERKEK